LFNLFGVKAMQKNICCDNLLIIQFFTE